MSRVAHGCELQVNGSLTPIKYLRARCVLGVSTFLRDRPNTMLNLRETGLDTAQAISVRADLYGLVVPFLVLACLCISARMYVRIKAGVYGIEDWCLVGGLVRTPTPDILLCHANGIF